MKPQTKARLLDYAVLLGVAWVAFNVGYVVGLRALGFFDPQLYMQAQALHSAWLSHGH